MAVESESRDRGDMREPTVPWMHRSDNNSARLQNFPANRRSRSEPTASAPRKMFDSSHPVRPRQRQIYPHRPGAEQRWALRRKRWQCHDIRSRAGSSDQKEPGGRKTRKVTHRTHPVHILCTFMIDFHWTWVELHKGRQSAPHLFTRRYGILILLQRSRLYSFTEPSKFSGIKDCLLDEKQSTKGFPCHRWFSKNMLIVTVTVWFCMKFLFYIFRWRSNVFVHRQSRHFGSRLAFYIGVSFWSVLGQ